jgi:AcrR family transcriptional regulator
VAHEVQSRRARGRPKLVIDRDELLDVVEHLFSSGGLDAVSIERAAEELGVSRATLYRAVPSKERLLGALLERMTDDLTSRSLQAVTTDGRTASERLRALMHVHFQAAIDMRDYLFVFFEGSTRLEPDDYTVWRDFTREYERIWVTTLKAAAAEDGRTLDDPEVAARLVIGMVIWVSRWYRSDSGIDATDLTQQAIQLLGGMQT